MIQDPVDVARLALMQALIIALPILGSGLVVGLFISLFQAVTQIQEMTLTFIPKILMVALVLLLLSPWMLQMLTDFATHALQYIPNVSH